MKSRALPFVFAIATVLPLLLTPQVMAAPRRRAAAPPAASYFCDFGTDVVGVTVPDGFCVRKFADVQTPRTLHFASNGDLFVASPQRPTPGGAPSGAGAIFLYRQTDTSKAPVRYTFADHSALESVHGLVISNGTFYYTIANSVQAVPYTVGDTRMAGIGTNIAELDSSGVVRWTHSLAAGTDGTIYVTRGQFDNDVCPTADARVGAVLRVGPGANSHGDIVIDGLRDPLYMRCTPWSQCYTAELSGDSWENLGGSEKLIEIHQGDAFGYPCCVDKNVPNPFVTPAPDCTRVAPVKQNYRLHDTPFGFDWERQSGWPAPYAGAFFVGLHGRFGSWEGAGLQWAPTDPTTHIPTEATRDFATGFGRFGAIGRVADVLFAPDGRLFFCDDQGGAIYWIAPKTLRR